MNALTNYAERMFLRKAYIVFLLSLCWHFQIRKSFFDSMAGRWKILMPCICDTRQMIKCIIKYC